MGSITGAKDVNELGRKIWRFLVCEDGPTAIEYAMMAALVIAVCVLAVDAVGSARDRSVDRAWLGGQ